jgi:hypothetical protein
MLFGIELLAKLYRFQSSWRILTDSSDKVAKNNP